MIRPLRGYVASPDAAAGVASPVAEDLSVADRERLIAANPDSSMNLLGDTPPELDRARSYLERVVSDGTFRPSEGWWVYRVTGDGHTQTGLVAEVAVTAYEAGNVLRHEHTMADVAARIADALELIGGSAHPVSLTYRHVAALDEFLGRVTRQEPDVRVEEAGRTQEAWEVANSGVPVESLRRIDRLYIADGHHRTAGFAELARRSLASGDDQRAHFPAVLFPDTAMRTRSYYRCLHLRNRPPTGVLADIAAQLPIEPMQPPAADAHPARGVIWVVADGTWHRLPLPDVRGAGPTAALDSARLQYQVLGPICDVADPRTDPRLTYVPGSLGYDELARICREQGGIGFATRPAGVADVMAVADAGGVLPPKSTWFTPKIGAGLFLRRV